jgi:hypothetical protein
MLFYLQYVVEAITDRRGMITFEYQVKWAGYPHDESTWEPHGHLIEQGVTEAIHLYESNQINPPRWVRVFGCAVGMCGRLLWLFLFTRMQLIMHISFRRKKRRLRSSSQEETPMFSVVGTLLRSSSGLCNLVFTYLDLQSHVRYATVCSRLYLLGRIAGPRHPDAVQPPTPFVPYSCAAWDKELRFPPDISDAQLGALLAVAHPHSVNLTGSIISCSCSNGLGLGHLRNNPLLKRLHFGDQVKVNARVIYNGQNGGRSGWTQMFSLRRNSEHTPHMMSQLRGLKLTDLDLGHLVELQDSDLVNLKEMPLRRLNLLNCCYISATGLRHVQLHQLVTLVVGSHFIKDEFLMELCRFNPPQLEVLVLRGTSVTDSGVAELTKVLSLVHLDIGVPLQRAPPDDPYPMHLTGGVLGMFGHSCLRTLIGRGLALNIGDLDSLPASLVTLRLVDCSGQPLDPHSTSSPQLPSNLRSLNVLRADFTDLQLQRLLSSVRRSVVRLRLAQCDNVTGVHFNHPSPRTAASISLPGVPVFFFYNPSWMANLNNLTDLDLSGSANVRNWTLGQLGKGNKLRRLILRNCAFITDRGVDLLAFPRRPRLQTLDLTFNNQLTEAIVPSLAKMDQLISLDLWRCDRISSRAIMRMHTVNPALLTKHEPQPSRWKYGDHRKKFIAA